MKWWGEERERLSIKIDLAINLIKPNYHPTSLYVRERTYYVRAIVYNIVLLQIVTISGGEKEKEEEGGGLKVYSSNLIFNYVICYGFKWNILAVKTLVDHDLPRPIVKWPLYFGPRGRRRCRTKFRPIVVTRPAW